MTRVLLTVVTLLALAGCATNKYYEKNVTNMQPGYGVMVATFKYAPGVSAFPQSAVLKDAKFTCDALTALRYQSFVVYNGGDTARVGIRASSHALALAYKKDFDSRGKIYLGGDVTLPVAGAEIVNITELRLDAAEKIP